MELQSDALDAHQESYGVKIFGQWGEFNSQDPSASVLYFSANARFSSSPLTDSQAALLRYMVPVRELLDVRDLRFDELLQRDLDDFRVSTELIRYAAGLDKSGGATFFPPILAVLLPHAEGKFIDMDPASETTQGQTHVLESSPFYRLTRLLPGPGADSSNLYKQENRRAELAWNDTTSKLVVIDGQHRVMALLALYRTIHNKWAQVEGWKYRNLYEDSVKSLLASETGGLIPIPDIELPVTVVLFPNLKGLAIRDAARKLFVDVNQGAKRPSASRLILLSDSDLVNVMTRELLQDIRRCDLDDNGEFARPTEPPLLQAIEYDSPSVNEDRGSPVRPTCILTLSALKTITELMVARSRRFVTQINPERVRDVPQREWWQNIKSSLNLLEQVGPLYEYEEDGETKEIALADVVPEQAPKSLKSKISDVFNQSYGLLFQDLVRQTEPYRTHLSSFEEQRALLTTGGPSQALVAEGLFDGVGTYFTLKNLKSAYDEKCRAMKVAGYPKPVRPLSADAFESLDVAIEAWYSTFALNLLGDSNPDTVAELRKLLERTNSIAALAGLAMTATHIVAKICSVSDRSFTSVPGLPAELAKAIAKSLNQAQSGVSAGGKSRRLLLSAGVGNAFNNIPKMEPDNWFEFRCLWFELLDDQGMDFLESLGRNLPDLLDASQTESLQEELQKAVDDARERLVTMSYKKFERLFKKDYPDDYDIRAFNFACEELLVARVEWFSWTLEMFLTKFNLTRDTDGNWDWATLSSHEDDNDVDDSDEDNAE